MSELKVNKISPATGTETTLGDASDDFLLPSGAEIKAKSGSTITIESGATLANAGTATGFGGGDTLLQKKWYYFNEGANMSSSNAWADGIHPIGDGTLTITPAATGNIIQIDWNWYLGHGPTWHSGAVRISYASGGGYSTAYGLGNDCGWGSMANNSSQGHTGSFSGTAWVAAANTNAHTFKFQHNGGGGGAPGIHLNNREDSAMSGSPVAYSNVSISEYDATSSAITAGGAL